MATDNTHQKIARHTLIQTGGKLISTVIGLIVIAMMTRYLGREGYGQYTIIIAFLQFFGILIDLGLTVVTLQMISEPGNKTDKILSNIFTIRLLSALFFLSLAPLVVTFFPYDPIVKTGVAITTLSFLFIALNQIVIGVFQKNFRMEKVAIAEIAGRLVLLALVIIFIAMKFSLLFILGAIVAGSFINFIFNFIASRRFAKIKLAFDWDVWKKIIYRSWPIAIAITLNLIYLKSDTIILSLYFPDSLVGLYGAPYRVVEITVMFPIMFLGLILPLLSNYWARQKLDKFNELVQNAFDALIILATPMVIGTIFLAEPIMVFVAGPDFIDSGPILKILIIATGIIFMATLFGHTVVAINKQRVAIWGYLATAIVALLGYFIFIPRYSVFGAAWVTVVSEGMIALITFYIVVKTTKAIPSMTKFAKAILASGFMVVPLYYLAHLHILILVAVAIITYAVFIYLLKGVSKELILDIIGSRKPSV